MDNLPAPHSDSPARESPLAAAPFLRGGRSVVLLHTTADGAAHFDWLCESAPPPKGVDERSLIAFRAARSPALLAAGESLPLERLAAHRRLYLDYEGPIAGDRGDVRRVAAGTIDSVEVAGERILLGIRWQFIEGKVEPGPVAQSLVLLPETASNWKLHCETRGKAAE